MKLNYMGTVHLVKAAAARMVARGRGHLVLVSSGAAAASFLGYASYAPSKARRRPLPHGPVHTSPRRPSHAWRAPTLVTRVTANRSSPCAGSPTPCATSLSAPVSACPSPTRPTPTPRSAPPRA
jgi:hypothetical protein